MVAAAGELIDGRFELREEIGRGATSIVYAAADLKAGGEVALKLLRPRGDARGVAGAAEALVRFRKEVASLATLADADAAIVAFRAAGELPGGGAYIAMERLVGRPLARVAQSFPLEPERAARIARDLAF